MSNLNCTDSIKRTRVELFSILYFIEMVVTKRSCKSFKHFIDFLRMLMGRLISKWGGECIDAHCSENRIMGGKWIVFTQAQSKSSHFLYIFVDKIGFVCKLWFWFQRLELSFFVYGDLSKCNFTKRRKLNFYEIKSNILNLLSILTITALCLGYRVAYHSVKGALAYKWGPLVREIIG